MKIRIIAISLILGFLHISCSNPERAWETARETNTEQAYEEFLDKYPNCEFADQAKQYIEDFRWARASDNNSINAYKEFIEENPESKYNLEAANRIDELEWSKATGQNTAEAYDNYLQSMPNGSYRLVAEQAAEKARWELAMEANTENAYIEFLNTYPSSTFIEQANAAIQLLHAITEAKEMIFDVRVQAKGSMTFSAIGTGGKGFKYAGTYETVGKTKIPQFKVWGYISAFVPGIRHKFVGHVYLPAMGETIEISDRAEGEGSSNSYGEFDYDGPITVSGELSYTPRPGGYFEIISDDASGLVLELTAEGYIYSMGAGTVRTPKGNLYTFSPSLSE